MNVADVLAVIEPRALTAQVFGWHDANLPRCVACASDIGVRGDAGVAVVVGPVLFCIWEGGIWVAHFFCRKGDWWHAQVGADPRVRTWGTRRYVLMATDWWMRDPQVAHHV